MKAHANTYVPPRRRFMRTLFGAAAGYTTPFLLDLDRIAAYAQNAPGYRAMVCIFLFGGNDSHNLIVPADQTSYQLYFNARTSIALQQSQLIPVAPLNLPGQLFGFHPNMPEIAGLFAGNKATVVANVGTLLKPYATKAQYSNGSVPHPPQLFSHSDQQLAWQTAIPNLPLSTGWCGRIADYVRAMNNNSTVSTSISLAGTNFMQRGQFVIPQSISTSGTKAVSLYNPTSLTPVGTAIQSMLLEPRRDLFDDYYMDTMSKSVDLNQILATALPNLVTAFPNTSLGNQLKMIARIIGARATLGMSRQIFFVAQQGYDTHSGQIAGQATNYQQLSQAMSAFYNATVELQVPDMVTQFTASDFGRTYSTNGGGTDHGWGSHQLVVGGAVQGGNIYGAFPPVPNLTTPSASHAWDIGEGRLLPNLSVDQYASTLAMWFGVAPADLPSIFPNLPYFNNWNLGFV